ncbi:Thromboxane-A synthase [Desmophyllum pertusum]|uniref:Thromboxane-A synthase n=1 Tax=Desmophyllum pertusum TaxID=174260 RepID=A0A9W9Z526_9CNID|nr:Thromboxane-A synthase [Desmophyllum pertusum]
MGENTEMLERANALFQVPFIVRQIARLPFGDLFLRLLSSLRGNQPGYFEGIAKEIITARRHQGLTGRKDLLHLMMMANDETTVEGVSRLADDEIISQSVFFILAGSETSSNTLAFALYYLVVNPDVQDKLRTEIQEAVETNTSIPLYDVAQNMVYLDCVIKEAQRLCPPAAQMSRECSEDYDLNGIHIPAGTEIVIPIYVMHHDPDAWEDRKSLIPRDSEVPLKTHAMPTSSYRSVPGPGTHLDAMENCFCAAICNKSVAFATDHFRQYT